MSSILSCKRKSIFLGLLLAAFNGVQAQPPESYNLVTNGDFTQQGLGWAPARYDNPGLIKSVGISTWGLEFAPSSFQQSMQQEIPFPVREGDTLVFQFQYKYSGASSWSPVPQANVYGYDMAQGASYFVANNQPSGALTQAANWTTRTQTLVVRQNFKKIQIQLYANFRSTDVGFIHIDNIELLYKPKGGIAGGGTGGGTGSGSKWTNATTTRIHYNDQVAIGGNRFYNDPNYKLSVNGRMVTEEVLVLLRADWPDYVFGSKYPLMPLDQLEKFIQKYKHLPGIPSAAQVAEKGGIEIGEMNRKLVEKIEELTLYIIQQQKRIEALEQQRQ